MYSMQYNTQDWKQMIMNTCVHAPALCILTVVPVLEGIVYKCWKTLLSLKVKGGGTGPAGPVLAGPLFHGGSNILEQTKNRSIAKNNSIIILDETILKWP